MNQGSIPTSKNDPDDIAEKGQATGIAAIADHFFSKWPQHK